MFEQITGPLPPADTLHDLYPTGHGDQIGCIQTLINYNEITEDSMVYRAFIGYLANENLALQVLKELCFEKAAGARYFALSIASDQRREFNMAICDCWIGVVKGGYCAAAAKAVL